MKSFRQYLTEDGPASTTGLVDLSQLLGALRLAGIHAGDRDSLTPYVTSRGMMGLHGATERIASVLRQYGLLVHTPTSVTRPSADHVQMTYDLYPVSDETRRIGTLVVVGEINPVDRGTVSYRVRLGLPPATDWTTPQQLF